MFLSPPLVCDGPVSRKDSLVIFLTGSIPKRQLDLFAVDLDIGDIVLKDGRDVYLHQTSVTNQRGGLSRDR